MGGATESQVALQFLGADYYWGSQTPCLSYYPFLHNTSVFDWLVGVRKTGVVNRSFVNTSIPMDPVHHYEDDWIRENWMSLFTPKNCGSCTSASLWNVYGAQLSPCVRHNCDDKSVCLVLFDHVAVLFLRVVVLL